MSRARKPKKGISKKPIKEISALDWYVIEQVKKIRKSKGISQATLSYELKYADSFVSLIESRNTPAHYNISHLNKIAKVLKCSLYDFFPEYPI